MSQGNRVALVLGSGGARGYAHLGALKVIEERGYEVVTIAGTSMGALVGGIAAAGQLEPYTEWSLSLTQREVWRLMDFALAGGGVIRAERIFARVAEVLGDVHIEDLPIPFTAVATDLLARREVWFQRGSLERAIRASVAIPGVITPTVVGGRLLVDGGVMNPVPIEPTAAVQSDLTVAVSLLGTRVTPGRATPEKASASARPLEVLAGRVRRSTADIAARFGVSREAAEAGPVEDTVAAPELGVMDLIDHSYETMSSMITRYRMAANPPDVLVEVPYNAVGTLDFHRCAQMTELGYRLTSEAFDAAGL